MNGFYDPEIPLKKRLIIAEGILNMYANGCNGSLYFINPAKEAEYRTPAKDYFGRFDKDQLEHESFDHMVFHALRHILPMAKAYAHANAVGSNQEIILQAESLIKEKIKDYL